MHQKIHYNVVATLDLTIQDYLASLFLLKQNIMILKSISKTQEHKEKSHYIYNHFWFMWLFAILFYAFVLQDEGSV